jgi:C4-dicarboxylate transporter, DctM subunit
LKLTRFEDRASAALIAISAASIFLSMPLISGLLLFYAALLGSIRSLRRSNTLYIGFQGAHWAATLSYFVLLILALHSFKESFQAHAIDARVETLYPSGIPLYFVFLPIVYVFSRMTYLGLRQQITPNRLPGFSLLVLSLLLFFAWVTQFHSLQQFSILIHKFEALPRREEFLILPATLVLLAAMRSFGGIRKAARSLGEVLPKSTFTAPLTTLLLTAAVALITGSSPLTLIAIAPVSVAYLRRRGYSTEDSVAWIAGTSSLGCLFPPAFMAVLYSMAVSETTAAISTTQLFRYSAILGSCSALALLLFARPKPRIENLQAVTPSIEQKNLSGILLSGTALSVLTFGIIGAFPIEWILISLAAVLFIYAKASQISFARISAALLGPTRSVCAFLPLVLLTFSVSDALALTGAETLLVKACSDSLSAIGFTLAWNGALLFAGALMDSVSATILFAPLLGAIATGVFGIAPHWFAVNFLINMELGYLIPPVATNLMLTSNLFNISQKRIYQKSGRILLVLMLALSLTATLSILTLKT